VRVEARLFRCEIEDGRGRFSRGTKTQFQSSVRQSRRFNGAYFSPGRKQRQGCLHSRNFVEAATRAAFALRAVDREGGQGKVTPGEKVQS